jgi:oxaloacetate decarboxylase gamma subunit
MNEIPGLVDAGINLAFLGMGTVFLFLTVLVGATSAMSFIVRRYSPTQSNLHSETDPRVLVAISAAVRAYRKKEMVCDDR